MDKIDTVATSLNLYFIMGGDKGFKKYHKDLTDNLEFKDVDDMPKWVKEQLVEDKENDWLKMAYDRWQSARRLGNTDFEIEKRCCYRMLEQCFNVL